jgi:hypothetical protein
VRSPNTDSLPEEHSHVRCGKRVDWHLAKPVTGVDEGRVDFGTRPHIAFELLKRRAHCGRITPPISGSRPWTFHTDRFYRESAASACSAPR